MIGDVSMFNLFIPGAEGILVPEAAHEAMVSVFSEIFSLFDAILDFFDERENKDGFYQVASYSMLILGN